MQKLVHECLFITVIIYNSQEVETIKMSIKWWMKEWNVYKMVYYWTIRRKELLIHVVNWTLKFLCQMEQSRPQRPQII